MINTTFGRAGVSANPAGQLNEMRQKNITTPLMDFGMKISPGALLVS